MQYFPRRPPGFGSQPRQPYRRGYQASMGPGFLGPGNHVQFADLRPRCIASMGPGFIDRTERQD